MKDLLEYANKQINPHLYPGFGGYDHYNHEMNLVGEDDYDYGANGDL